MPSSSVSVNTRGLVDCATMLPRNSTSVLACPTSDSLVRNSAAWIDVAVSTHVLLWTRARWLDPTATHAPETRAMTLLRTVQS